VLHNEKDKLLSIEMGSLEFFQIFISEARRLVVTIYKIIENFRNLGMTVQKVFILRTSSGVFGRNGGMEWNGMEW
jgi:hypothetical protein